jgi:hypothetical protein
VGEVVLNYLKVILNQYLYLLSNMITIVRNVGIHLFVLAQHVMDQAKKNRFYLYQSTKIGIAVNVEGSLSLQMIPVLCAMVLGKFMTVTLFADEEKSVLICVLCG